MPSDDGAQVNAGGQRTLEEHDLVRTPDESALEEPHDVAEVIGTRDGEVYVAFDFETRVWYDRDEVEFLSEGLA
jgi:hypothetical protein